MFIIAKFCFSCTGTSFQCYYILLMNQTANATSVPSQPDVMSAWNTFKCSLDLGCKYQNTFRYPYPPDLVPPKLCPPLLPPPSFGGQNGPPGRRRKRQAPSPGGHGGPGGVTPPPVSPDFNTSAIFLQKYMELDVQDRLAIGHRFIAFSSLSILCFQTFPSGDGLYI